MEIGFDPAKDAENRRKHGVSLAFAADVLADVHRIDVLDVRLDYGEDRFVTYGMGHGRGPGVGVRLRSGRHGQPHHQREKGQ